MADIRDIAFEQINADFSRGTYLGLAVVIHMKSGYINGTQLVAQAMNDSGHPKRITHWLETSQYVELRDYLMPILTKDSSNVISSSGIPELNSRSFKIIFDINDAPNGLRGKYIHPRLISHAAQWSSPIFADKVGIILNNRAVSEAMHAKNAEMASLQEKYDRIEKLFAEQMAKTNMILDFASDTKSELSSANAKLDTTVQTLAITNTMLSDTSEKLDIAETRNEALSENVVAIAEKLGVAIIRRVPIDDQSDREHIVTIVRKPNTLEYQIVRCQKRSQQTALKKQTVAGYTEVVYEAPDPNATNTANRIRSKITPDIGRKFAYCGIIAVDHDAFIHFVTALESDRDV